MTDKKHKKQHGVIVWCLRALLVATPVLIAVAIGLVNLVGQGVFAPGIKWNDEAVYLKLVETYANMKAPVGYYGFDLEHAIRGTGSAWSPAIIWPYAALFKVIGGLVSEYSFVYVANLIFITVANALFVVMAIPKRNQTVRLICIEATSAVMILYLCTNMSEIFRFSIAIVIAGMLYRMMYLKSNKVFRFVVVPLFILYAVQVYTFFAFAIPLYVYALRKEYGKKRDFWLQTIWAGLATVIVGGGSYVLLHFISSNYNIAKTERLLGNLSSGQLVEAARALVWMVKDGLYGIYSLLFTFKSNPIYMCHLLITFTIIAVGVAIAIRNKKGDRTLGLMATGSVVIFFGAYATLYTIVPDTFMRGTEIVIIFALFMMCMSESKLLIYALLLVNALGMFALPQNMEYFTREERYMDSTEIQEWESLKKRFDSQIVMIDSDDPWDNTVAMYTMEPKVINTIPTGMGINFALKGYKFSDKPSYLVFTKHEKLRPDWVETDFVSDRAVIETGLDNLYINIYEDDEYVIYRQTKTIGREVDE